MDMRRTKSYMWLLGQDENLGDAVLRRRLLRAVAEVSDPVVYVGDATPSFVECLTAGIECRVSRSSLEWYLDAAKSLVRNPRHWAFTFNPGEVRANRMTTMWHLKLLPLLLVARLLGGRVLSFGVGLHSDSQPWAWTISRVVGLSRVVAWRDTLSPRIAGRGVTLADLAFDEPPAQDATATDAQRELVTVSWRGDREPPDEETLRELNRTADALGAQLVFTAQVRSDNALNERLAALLPDARFVAWPDDVSHAEQERRVRELYRASHLVVSDRLHCLIIGLTEGAVPLCVSVGDDKKVARHFAAAGLSGVVISSTPAAVRTWTNEPLERRREEALAALRTAQTQVATVDQTLTTYLSR